MQTPDTLELDRGKRTRFVPDETLEWLRDSELIEDEPTIRAVEALSTIYHSYGLLLGDDVMQASAPALVHRAPEVATGPDGEPIEAYADIPGDLGSMAMEVLCGHETKAAMEEHCSSLETEVAAALLNMATRWARGKEAYKWTKRTIAESEESGGPFLSPIMLSRKVSALEDVEQSVIDDV